MGNLPNLLAVVALTEDLPTHNLCRGQVGTIVEELASEVFEVEFSDSTGRPYARAPVKAAKFMMLHYEPIEVAS